MSWPTLQDGTVDWAEVFENADNGLIQLIDTADDEAKLKACCHVVIHSLFQRDADAAFRASYIQRLDTLFDGVGAAENLITIKGRIRVLLRQMKAERMQRALAHARQKQGTATAEDERRLAADDPLAPLKTLDTDADG
jgi:hypothetical protein